MQPAVEIPLPAGANGAGVLSAAYAMTDRAYVGVCRRGKRMVLLLWPKPGADVKSLRKSAPVEFENAQLRWRLATQGQGIRAEILRRMLALYGSVTGPDGRRVKPALPKDQEAKISRLLEENTDQSQDPRGIRQVWTKEGNR